MVMLCQFLMTSSTPVFIFLFILIYLFFLQCCDLGYHASLARMFRTYLSAEYNLETSRHEGLDLIESAVDNLDSRSDKHKIMDMFNQVFCPPMRFEYLPHMGDEVRKSGVNAPSNLKLIVCSRDGLLCTALNIVGFPEMKLALQISTTSEVISSQVTFDLLTTLWKDTDSLIINKSTDHKDNRTLFL